MQEGCWRKISHGADDGTARVSSVCGVRIVRKEPIPPPFPKREGSHAEGRCVMTRQDSPQTQARNLVSTSVDDLRSSLYFYQWNIKSDVETIRLGLLICEQRGEKTKAVMLRRKLKKMQDTLKTWKEVENASV